MTVALGRRAFLGRALALGGAAVAAQTLGNHAAWAEEGCPGGTAAGGAAAVGYGPLQRVGTENTGEELLALPVGFRYRVFGESGSTMSDGTTTPIAHDGMAAFPGPQGTLRLIRNHEVRLAPGSVTGAVGGPAETRYDEFGVAGTTTLDLDPHTGRVLQDFVSLNGTFVNCAGGKMLGDAGWVTCEETVDGRATVRGAWGTARLAQPHGYAYVVPLVGPRPGHPATAEPIHDMGRFSHEAVAVDPGSGYVYETEDDSGKRCGFYRFRPDNPADLTRGGVLEMLKIRGRSGVDLRKGQRVPGTQHGTPLPVEWVRIEEPDPELEVAGTPRVAEQGLAGGAATFNRLEGCWYGQGSVYFNSTSGGDARNGDVNSRGTRDEYHEGYGQVWKFTDDADGGTLTLLYESPGRKELDSPDNLVFTPRGGILICEDDASAADRPDDVHPLAPGFTNVNRLIGLTLAGQPFEFAVNITDTSEFAGACFSPDGRTLFVNTLGSTDVPSAVGRTYAVTGPWSRGPL